MSASFSPSIWFIQVILLNISHFCRITMNSLSFPYRTKIVSFVWILIIGYFMMNSCHVWILCSKTSFPNTKVISICLIMMLWFDPCAKYTRQSHENLCIIGAVFLQRSFSKWSSGHVVNTDTTRIRTVNLSVVKVSVLRLVSDQSTFAHSKLIGFLQGEY